MVTHRQLYSSINERELPLFARPWWLSAVSESVGKDWDALVSYGSDGRLVAAMPFQITRRGIFSAFLMPQLSQISHIWTDPSVDRLSAEEGILEALKREMRDRHALMVQFADYMTEAEADLFKKAGFTLTERVSYRIEPQDDFSAVERAFHYEKKRMIRKAEGCLHVEEDYDPESPFYTFLCKNLADRGMRPFYAEKLWRSLWKAGLGEGRSVILWAKEGEQPVSAVMLVWSEDVLYYLIPTFCSSAARCGVMEWLTREAIRYAHERGLIFDFEGSSVPSIGRAYRHFGSEKHTFMYAERYANRFVRWVLSRR